jgi:toxin-antitoxin system PIN domain toxin
MILVDSNLLLYAQDSLSQHHDQARRWWDERLSGSDTVCLCWPVLTTFVRIGTNARLHQRPLTIREMSEIIDSWLDQPCVRLIVPGDSHWQIYRRILRSGQATGNLTMDAHLAALAIEHGCRLCSTDADFARFANVKWENPLKD